MFNATQSEASPLSFVACVLLQHSIYSILISCVSCVRYLLLISSNASLSSSKELLTQRPKELFDSEMQRHLDDCSDSDAIRFMQDQVCRLKWRCAKLERTLQEKESEIQSMHEQQQLQFPLLVHENMRNFQLLDGIQSEEEQYAARDRLLSHSVMSVMAHDRQDVDVCVHEYEQQIAKLYEENRNEKLKNEMLSECLRDQKHAKAKLMKACKQAKQKLQAVHDSGLSQMLLDIEARCDALQKKNAHMADEISVETSLRKKCESEKIVLVNQLEELRHQSTKWEGIVAGKNEMLQQARDQICEHQLTIENLTADLELADRSTARSPDHYHDNAEVQRLKRIINTEQAALIVTEQRLSTITAENNMLRRRCATNDKTDSAEEHIVPCAAQDVFDRVLIQIQHLQYKLRSLTDMLKQYEETNFFDVNALDEETWFHEDCAEGSALSCVEYATHLSNCVAESARSLYELQEIVVDVGARLLGESCALQ